MLQDEVQVEEHNQDLQQEVENDQFTDLLQDLIRNNHQVAAFKEMRQYINGNKPSFNLLEKYFSQAIIPELEPVFFGQIQNIIKSCLENNLQRVFMRVLFSILSKNSDKLDLQQLQNNNIQTLWQKVNPQDLRDFISVFKLEGRISQADLLSYYGQLIKRKKFDEAFQFFNALKFDKKEFQTLMDAMATNNDAGKAADYIKRLNYDADEYPKVVERLQKNCIRYILKEYEWFKCEEMLQKQKKLLAFLCEDLYHSGRKLEALSIVHRNGLLPLVTKQDIKQAMSLDFEQGFQELPNILFQQDAFRPTDELLFPMQQYIRCEDFGVGEESVVFVSGEDEKLDFAIDHLSHSKMIGLDTEHLTPITKLDKEATVVYLLQLSSSSKAFLFDVPQLAASEKFKGFLKQIFQDNEAMKVGLAIRDDLCLLCKVLNLRQLIIRSIIDLGGVFKQLGNDSTKRSLAHISEFYFKKSLSKLDSCSDWSARPLRKAQLHYAALDALICVHVSDEMIKQNKEIFLGEKDVMQIE